MDKMNKGKIIRKMNEDLTLSEFLAKEEDRPNTRIASGEGMKQSISLQQDLIKMNNQVYPDIDIITAPAFSPSDIEGLQLQLESDQGITLSGSDVDVWADQSGNGNNASAPTASNRPAYGTNQLNGIDLLTFDGINNYLTRANNVVSGSSNRTIFVVSSSNDDSSSRKMFSDGDGSTNGNEFSITPEYAVRVQGGNKVFSTANTSTAAIFTTKLDGSNSTDLVAWKNGITLSESSSTSQAINTGGNDFYIGARDFNGDPLVEHFFDGDIAAVLVYNRALTEEERTNVEVYLANKYGLAHPQADWVLALDEVDQVAVLAAGQTKDDYEAQNSNALALRLESDSGITLSGSDVDVWADQSFEGNNASAPTASNRPAYGSTTLNGINLLSFDGVDEFLSAPDDLSLDLVDSMTIFAVCSNYISGNIFTKGDQNFEVNGYYLSTGLSLNVSGTRYALFNSWQVGGAIQSYVIDSGNGEAYLNGILQDTNTGMTNTPNNDPLYIGRYSPSNFLSGDIAAILIFNTALTDSQRDQVELYLANKYGLAHPNATWVQALDGPDQAAVLASGQTKDDYEAQNVNSMVLRLESDQGITTTGALNNEVDTWADQSFSGNNASAPTASNRPAYGTNTLNGIDVLTFDGISEYFDLTGMTNPASNYTFFFVKKNNNASSSNGEFLFDTETGRFVVASPGLVGTAPYVEYAYFDGSWGGGGSLTTSFEIVSYSLDSASGSNIRVNGSSVFSGSYSQLAISGTTGLFARFDGTGATFFDGDIAAVLVYNVALSDTDRGRVETYLANKFGITLA